jgi:hypothetical protein
MANSQRSRGEGGNAGNSRNGPTSTVASRTCATRSDLWARPDGPLPLLQLVAVTSATSASHSGPQRLSWMVFPAASALLFDGLSRHPVDWLGVMSLLLHLSDLHLGNTSAEDQVGDYKIEAVPEEDRVTRIRLMRSTLTALSHWLATSGETLDGVIITGDVTTRGRPEAGTLVARARLTGAAMDVDRSPAQSFTASDETPSDAAMLKIILLPRSNGQVAVPRRHRRRKRRMTPERRPSGRGAS